MRILFLCTAHNSLSQRLSLELSSMGHRVSVEYALSDEVMIDAANLFEPDLILCPFLTTRVPQEIYANYMTLIVHPGPPGDSGPSAIDWMLMGDDGTISDTSELLAQLNKENRRGRGYWGVTILQAIEDFDAGPVWAFDQFPIDIDEPGLTKSTLYRGAITQAAVSSIRAAIARLEEAAKHTNPNEQRQSANSISPRLQADAKFKRFSVTSKAPFQGGNLHHRPLLKAISRDFDPNIHSAVQISRRIRSSDSQPGAQSKIFGPSLYLYGGTIEENLYHREPLSFTATVKVLGIRDEAVCISTCDGLGVWITHVRRLKGKAMSLWPKVPAVSYLLELGVLSLPQLSALYWPLPTSWEFSKTNTYQEIWLEFRIHENGRRVAYLHFDFYNGAMSTSQCSRLIDAMDYVLAQSTEFDPIDAIVLMGGTYFSNGIALTVIEAAADPSMESWLNINRVNDVVYRLLHTFPARGILTVGAIRGNAAAGGVALATACDIVIAGSDVVLNPAYRAIGLYGSEYHTLSYVGRCGEKVARKLLRAMKPLSATQAQRVGLVDLVFPGHGDVLDDYIRGHISLVLAPGSFRGGVWKMRVDCSKNALDRVRAFELSEMGKDFWSARSVRYHSRRAAFVRKTNLLKTPSRFAVHRRLLSPHCVDEEESDQFDEVEYFRKQTEEQIVSRYHDIWSEQARSQHPDRGVIDQATSRRLSVIPMTPLESSGYAVMEAKMSQNLFSCYYRPLDDLPSPLEASPVEIPLSDSPFAHSPWSVKTI